MRRPALALVVALIVAAWLAPGASAALPSGNLLQNRDAEAGTCSNTTSPAAAVPAWTTTGSFTVVCYTAGVSQTSGSGSDIDGGNAYFMGGVDATTTATQTVDVSSGSAEIDAGTVRASLTGDLGGFSSQGDNMVVTATFVNGSGNPIGSPVQIGPVTASDRSDTTELQDRSAARFVPAGTRSIRVVMTATRVTGTDNDAAADNLALRLSSAVRVSHTGSDSDTDANSNDPSLAYDPQAGHYLAVWRSISGPAGARQITASFLDPAGRPVGSPFAISDPGPACDQGSSGFDCGDTLSDPIVAYNSHAHEFYVVWHRTPTPSRPTDDCGSGGVPGLDVVGQRLSASGARLGSANTLSTPLISGCARDPQVRYSSTSNRYVVVWDDSDASDKVYAIGVNADGTKAALSETAISSGTGVGDADLAYDSRSDQFLAVWSSASTIQGQRLSTLGAPVGSNFEIEGTTSQDAAAAFNSQANDFLVAFTHEVPDSEGGTKKAIQGRRISPTGTLLGSSAFDISGSQFSNAQLPALTYNPDANQYQTVFQGTNGPDGNEFESVFGQQLDASGAKIGTDGLAISSIDDDEEPRSVVYNPSTCEYLVAWEGLTNDKTEIFDSRLPAPIFARCQPSPGPGTAPKVVGNGGNGGAAGPCGGGGGGGGGLGAGGGGAGGGGCFARVVRAAIRTHFTRDPQHLRVSCHLRSRTTAACGVRWRRRSSSYRGTAKVAWQPDKWRIRVKLVRTRRACSGSHCRRRMTRRYEVPTGRRG